MLALICPVRGCGQPLQLEEQALRCARGHSFDLARSGYCNLLQPQDRRSPRPGDSREVVAARRRWLDRGFGEPLLAALRDLLGGGEPKAGSAVLDAGCGEGTNLAAVAGSSGCEAAGVDISTAAVDAAARRHPGITWIVANADRVLPFGSGAFHLVLSVNARLNAAEFKRVLGAGGRLLVAVPAADDLVELRAAAQGRGIQLDRTERVLAEVECMFQLERRAVARASVWLDRAAVNDALLLTYRGGRRRVAERAAAIEGLQATLAWDILLLRPC